MAPSYRPPADQTETEAGNALSVRADGSIAINAGKLPAPRDVYDADIAWPELRHGAVSLFFAKLDPAEPKRLFSRVEVRYPVEVFVGHLWENSRSFHEDMKAQLAKTREPGSAPSLVAVRQYPASKSHSLWATYDYMARAGSHAVIDFYYLAPSAIVRLARLKDASALHLDPVLRVMFTTHELDRLLDACDPIVSEIRRLAPQEQQ